MPRNLLSVFGNPKEHIEFLLSQIEVGKGTSIGARMLTSQMGQQFHDSRNFIFELLQNAEDAKAKHVQYVLDDDTLFVLHNGDPFTEYDVGRICDAARDQDVDETGDDAGKHHDQGKIGYKGIGFKSVFGVSKDVEIHSMSTERGNYHFGFSDKNSHAERGGKTYAMPWQVMPIWCEEGFVLPCDCQPNPVTFVLKRVDGEKLAREFEVMQTNPEIIVFFNHIRCISFRINGVEHSLVKNIVENEDNNQRLTITQQNQRDSQITEWLMHRRTVQLAEYSDRYFEGNLQDQLQSLSPESCPVKIKDADATEIRFAAQIQHQDGQYHFVTIKKDIFCYLPTNVACHLPFLVNANFVLDQARTNITDIIWNQFLLIVIGQEQFSWYGEMASDKRFRHCVFSLLSNEKPEDIFPSFKKRYERMLDEERTVLNLFTAYQQGFSVGLKQVPFVLSKTGQLLRIGDTAIDITKVFRCIDESLLDEELIFTGGDTVVSRLVAYEVDDRDRLRQLSEIRTYDWEMLLHRVEGYMQRLTMPEHVDMRSQFIKFLFNSKEVHTYLLKRILINTEGVIRTPYHCVLREADMQANEKQAREFFPTINVVSLEDYSEDVHSLLRQHVQLLDERALLTVHLKQVQLPRIALDLFYCLFLTIGLAILEYEKFLKT